MLISKLLEKSLNAQDAVDKLLGREPRLEKQAERENKILVHCYVVGAYLRRRTSRRKSLKLIQGGRS